MTGHIILTVPDGMHILDNADSIWIDNETENLVISYSGKLCYVESDNIDDLYSDILAAFEKNGSTLIRGHEYHD